MKEIPPQVTFEFPLFFLIRRSSLETDANGPVWPKVKFICGNSIEGEKPDHIFVFTNQNYGEAFVKDSEMTDVGLVGAGDPAAMLHILTNVLQMTPPQIGFNPGALGKPSNGPMVPMQEMVNGLRKSIGATDSQK